MALEKPRDIMVKHPKVLFDPGKQNFYHRNEKGKEP